MSSTEKSISEIFSGLKVCPDPDPCDAERDQRAISREASLVLLMDRGCPRLVAEAVANIGNVNGPVRTLDAIKAAGGWLAMDMSKRGRTVLVLSGARGRGKSFAAGHLLMRQRAGSFAQWANARHISTWMHHLSDHKSRTMLERASRAPMLVIDDMGWEHLDRHGYIRGGFVGLLDDRIQAKYRTAITTNMSEDDFRARYGDALHDRVRGYGTWVDVETGPSLR